MRRLLSDPQLCNLRRSRLQIFVWLLLLLTRRIEIHGRVSSVASSANHSPDGSRLPTLHPGARQHPGPAEVPEHASVTMKREPFLAQIEKSVRHGTVSPNVSEFAKKLSLVYNTLCTRWTAACFVPLDLSSGISSGPGNQSPLSLIQLKTNKII